MEDTRALIRRFILTSLGDDDMHLDDDQSLERTHVVDSARMIEIFTFIEEQFGITVENDEALPENFDTVSNIVAYIQRKLAHEEARASA